MTDDGASRLRWAARHYLPLALTIAAIVMVIAVLRGTPTREGPEYEARALVVATALEVRPDQVPRFANSIFVSGAVAEEAVRSGRLPYEPSELIRDHVELDPVQDNVVVFVEGR